MTSSILITPLDNIEDGCIVDPGKVTRETHNSKTSPLTFEGRTGRRRDTLNHVSLYEDLLIKDDVKYKILHMITT